MTVRKYGVALRSAAREAARCSSVPIVLMNTFAWRRSGDVSTPMTVTKPKRGSLIERDMRADLFAKKFVNARHSLRH